MTVTVQYYKYPRTLHWRHDLTRLGEDEHGVWLGGEVGAIVQRGHEPPRQLSRPIAQLITPDRWWSAIFNGGGHELDAYVDIVTVATWPEPGRAEMVDLDLDVVRLRDGTIYVDDEDEFEEHRASLGYPPKMVDSARATAARLVLALERQAPPFDGTSARWLSMVEQPSAAW